MAHTTIKITQLPSASSADITSLTDVLPIIDGDTTKQITVDNLFGTATNITASGNISASGTIYAAKFESAGEASQTIDFNDNINITGNLTASGVISSSKVDSGYSLFAHSASISYISASHIDTNAGSIAIGGTPFTKTDIDDLKLGRSLNKTDARQIVNEADTSTYVRMGQGGRAYHYASNVALLRLQTSSFGIGSTLAPMTLEGSSLSITGSTEITGSTTIDGSFGVGNLLNLLANFGQTGLPTGSGEGGVASGDINLDGQVNINDLLLLLAGFGNPNIIVNNLTIPINTNYQLVGPEITVSQSIVLTVGTDSFLTIT